MEIVLKAAENTREWVKIYKLYLTAFPASERKPFSVIRRMFREGRAHVWCILAQGKFAGMAATVNGDDLILVDYFAVSKKLRGHGIGKLAMECLIDMYRDKGVFLEIESPDRPGLDQDQRKKRKAFYLSCGYEELGVRAKVFGVYMELLGIRCQLDYSQYRNFYGFNMSPWAADHLEELK